MRDLIKEVDKDMNGTIEFDEFLQVCINACITTVLLCQLVME